MKYLYSEQGVPVSFILEGAITTIHAIGGEQLAEIDDGFVYDNKERHIGWLVRGELYNRKGEIVLSGQNRQNIEAPPPSQPSAPRTRNRRACETAHGMPSFFGDKWAKINGLAFFRRPANRNVSAPGRPQRTYYNSSLPPLPESRYA